MKRSDFHRLFLQYSTERGVRPYALRISPCGVYSEELPPALQHLAFDTAEAFVACLRHLGASAISEFIGEEAPAAPLFGSYDATPEEIHVKLCGLLKAQHARLTALVYGEPVSTMAERISSWQQQHKA